MKKHSRKILITGYSGLIGSHLIRELINENFDLFLVGRHKNEEWTSDRINFLPIDLSGDWDTSILPSKIDIIVHLSQSENFRDFPSKAEDVFYVNTLSTLKLINYAINSGCERFIYASSAGIYGNSTDGFNENQEIIYKNELGFYLATKHCSEVILENYANLINIDILRFFFVYGKGQRKDMLIPRLVNNVKNGIPITLQGKTGLRINPTHVSDAVSAIKILLESSARGQKYNIAGDEVFYLKEIVDIIGRRLKIEPQYTIIEEEPRHLIGDISKMKKELCSPKMTFSQGIGDLI
jgi:nucleoside-diphosphate-sugar epimerase